MRTRRYGASAGTEASGDLMTSLRTQDSVESLTFVDDDGRRDRIGWFRGIIATLVVAIAAVAVIGTAVLILRQVGPTTPAASSQTSAAAVTSSSAAAPSAAAPTPTTPAAVAPAPVAPAPAPTEQATQASGRAAQGDRTLSFIVATANLRAGVGTSVTVSGTGPATDRVMSVTISTADGANLASGSADGCSGPAFPWSQQFAITFDQAESTQLQVQMVTCNGTTLVATSLVNIEP